MKKFMIGLLFIILLSTTLSANAETVVLKSNYYDKPLDSCYEYHDVLVKSNDGILFWWTGTEFIKCSLLDTKFTKSDDLVEWSDIDISYDVRMKISGLHRANIKHYGDKYIVYNEIYFNPSLIIDKMERIYGPIIKPIYTFDENFNLVNEFQLDKPLTDFEYVDGVYYAETQEYTKLGPQEYESKNTIYYSYDAIDWQIDNEMSHMPQSNGRNTLVFQGKLTNYVNLSNYRFEVKDMFIERNKSDLIKVVQERPITCYYKAKGNIYVETQYDNVDTFRISRDGVYSVDVAIPADSDDEHIIICDLWKDKLVLWTRNRLIEYDMADIEDVLNENSNKNGILASTQRDLVAGEVSKDMSRRKLIPAHIVHAHDEGVLHYHDMDYAMQPIHNCMLINLEDMLNNGTVINNKLVESPKSFGTACTIVTQIIAQIASAQYGGNTITIKHIAPFLRVSYNKYLNKYKEKYSLEMATELAQERMMEELKSGIQTIRYQLSTLHTSNGQSPFCTIYLEIEDGHEYEKEMALICEEMIVQRLEGMKNYKGQVIGEEFPKLVYLLDEHNCLEGGKYDYITKLAAKCNTKRLVPDYQSAKMMRKNYDGETFPPMGCRSHLSNWKDENGNYKWYGRFNQGRQLLCPLAS